MPGAIVTLAGAVTVATIATALVTAGAATAARQRAVVAADAAAPAAAARAPGARAREPCALAERLARAHHAEVRTCTIDGLIATVGIGADFGAFQISATARAGPPQVVAP
ncbi:helicase [Microbacteriaceae bacterium K1510]|nr:helicase [Microbacteriaceae bacterium K1510]